MKKLVNCIHWNEYEGLNGPVAFCAKGAYEIRMTVAEEIACGCSTVKRKECLAAMVAINGFGLVPDLMTALSASTGESRAELVGSSRW